MLRIAIWLSAILLIAAPTAFGRTTDSISRAAELDRPNLIAIPMDFSPDRIQQTGGEFFSLSGAIQNTGTRPSTGTVTFEVFVSKDLVRDAGDLLLISTFQANVEIAPGAAKPIATPSSFVTRALPPGQYFVGLGVDSTNRIAEQREYDNFGFVRFRKLRVGPPVLGVARWNLYD